MRILIRSNFPKPAFADRNKWKWAMFSIRGTWVEVDTKCLFKDQFNTAPIPGISEMGLRIHLRDVEKIEDDVRSGMEKCSWCGRHQPVGALFCTRCNQVESLYRL